MSLGETQLRPTAMLFRNLASMDVEESIRGNPHRRRRAAHGLRQDHARAAHGRGELRPAHHRHFRRTDVVGPLPRQADRFGHRRVADVRGRARRQDDAGRIHRRRILHAPLEGPLHDHGHGIDDGEHGRSARRRAARQRGDSRRRCAPLPAGAAHRPAHRRDGRRRNGAVEDPHARRVRERDPRERRDRRLDERGDPPARDRRPHRRAAQARGLGQDRLASCRAS